MSCRTRVKFRPYIRPFVQTSPPLGWLRLSRGIDVLIETAWPVLALIYGCVNITMVFWPVFLICKKIVIRSQRRLQQAVSYGTSQRPWVPRTGVKKHNGFFFAHLLAPHCTGCFAHALHCSHVLTLLHSFAHTRTRTNALPLFWKLIEFRPFWVALLRYHRWLVRSFFLTKYDIKSTHFISAQKPSLVTPNIRCVPPSSKPLITTNSSIWAPYNSLGAYCVLLCVRLQKFWWTEHVTHNGGLIYNAPP